MDCPRNINVHHDYHQANSYFSEGSSRRCGIERVGGMLGLVFRLCYYNILYKKYGLAKSVGRGGGGEWGIIC